MASSDKSHPVHAQLGLWDAVSIIVGIVIGTSIYQTAPTIFQNVESPWMGLGVWALGGFLSLIGALCYAELATAYPRSGGDYVYLTRAFGSITGFLFGWAQIVVILTGSIGMMGFVFGDYAVQLWELPKERAVQLAFAAVLGLALLNVLGVVLGKWVQNLLSLAKVLGLGGIVISGLLWGKVSGTTMPSEPSDPSFGLALILVLYAYGGWNDAAFVAADLRDRRQIPRALLLGTGLVTVVYLLVNFAYLQGLGFQGARKADAIAAKVLELPLDRVGFKAMCILVMISALGAINGLIFTGSRVCSALGAEHSVFAALGRWHPKLGSPLWSLLTLAVASLVMIVGVGTEAGQHAIDSALTAVGIPAIPWGQYFGGFNTLFAGTAPVFWTFFLLTGLSIFVLRAKDAQVERPFRIPLFPIVPLIFCGMCGYGIYASMVYAKWVSLLGWIPLAVGLPLFLISRYRPVEGGTQR